MINSTTMTAQKKAKTYWAQIFVETHMIPGRVFGENLKILHQNYLICKNVGNPHKENKKSSSIVIVS